MKQNTDETENVFSSVLLKPMLKRKQYGSVC